MRPAVCKNCLGVNTVGIDDPIVCQQCGKAFKPYRETNVPVWMMFGVLFFIFMATHLIGKLIKGL